MTPRYGEGALGGAEFEAADYAKRLGAAGHDVEILTTCALDHSTFENVLEEGETVENGHRVRRFAVEPGDRDRFGSIEWRIQRRMRVTRDEELDWMRTKGYSPGLIEYLVDSDHDKVILLPYLYANAYFGTMAIPDRAVLHTLLHDEPYARLSITAEMVGAASAILFNSLPEVALAERLFGTLPPHAIGGVGFEADEPPSADERNAFRVRYGLDERPFILYAGRWEGGKGVPRLVSYAMEAHDRGAAWDLALIGSGPEAPKRRGRGVVPVGYVDDDEKAAAFAAADIFCQPSPNESLSIVLIEAWLAGTPALVSGSCAVTRHHCQVSGGGLWFDSFPEFEVAVELMRDDRHRMNQMAAAGRAYALDFYSPEAITERVTALLESV